MTFSTSAVAVCCWSDSSSSRASWSSLSCSFVGGVCPIGTLRALRLVVRRTFIDRPLLRRRIVAPEVQTGDGINSRVYSERGLTECFRDVRFGSLADICGAKGHVRFAPNSDHESRLAQTVMSALPPKADVSGANRHVCFGPIADSRTATKQRSIRSPHWRGAAILARCSIRSRWRP
jgi:hypothetical protein